MIVAAEGDGATLDLVVVVPCHNAEPTLAAQLEALIAQDWDGRWLPLVVDNRSTDGTAALARGYADRGVHLVEAQARSGVAYARNVGARTFKTSAVAFCDGDDVVRQGWLRALARALATSDIVSGSLDTSCLNPRWLAGVRPALPPGQLPKFGSVPFASGATSAVRMEAFERLNGYDEDFVGLEDIEFSLRATAAGLTIASAPDAVVDYRLRPDLRGTLKQGFFYGRGRPELNLTARRLGLPAPSRLEGLRSWAWLVTRVPGLRTRSGRYRFAWVLANRLGVLAGSFHVRSPFI